jgi:polyphosphate glucokinase
MAKIGIGIDIGGTGIKGSLVDIAAGELVGERLRVETPAGGRPDDIAAVVKSLIKSLDPKAKAHAVGICFPAVVQHGVTLSAANVSQEWIGLDADALFTRVVGREVHLINDADAAGVAEMKFGVGRKESGVTLMTTLGTGIGTALFIEGELVPNTELGHIEIDGVDYETKAAFSAKEREELTWDEWAARLQLYYSKLEALFTPDLFIVGGGVSKEHELFLPLLKLKTRIVPATLKNNAGIIGAARVASKNKK